MAITQNMLELVWFYNNKLLILLETGTTDSNEKATK